MFLTGVGNSVLNATRYESLVFRFSLARFSVWYLDKIMRYSWSVCASVCLQCLCVNTMTRKVVDGFRRTNRFRAFLVQTLSEQGILGAFLIVIGILRTDWSTLLDPVWVAFSLIRFGEYLTFGLLWRDIRRWTLGAIRITFRILDRSNSWFRLDEALNCIKLGGPC